MKTSRMRSIARVMVAVPLMVVAFGVGSWVAHVCWDEPLLGLVVALVLSFVGGLRLDGYAENRDA